MINTEAEIILALRDLFSAPAKRAAQAAKNVQRESKQAQKEADKLSTSLSKLGSRLKTLAAGMLSWYGVRKLFDFYKLGVDVRDLHDEFVRLGGSLTYLQAQTRGLISTFDLMRLHNKARMIGLTAEQFATLAQFADYASDTLGEDLVPVLEKLLQSMATGRTYILKQFGIEANNINDALEQMGKIVAELPEGFQSANDSFLRMQASLENLKVQFGLLLSATDAQGESILGVAEAFDTARESLHLFVGYVKAAWNVIQATARVIVGSIGYAIIRLTEGEEAARRWNEVVGEGLATDFNDFANAMDLVNGKVDIWNSTAKRATKRMREFKEATQEAKTAVEDMESAIEELNTKALQQLDEQLKEEARRAVRSPLDAHVAMYIQAQEKLRAFAEQTATIEETAQEVAIDRWAAFYDRLHQYAQMALTQIANLWTQFWETIVTQDWDSLLVGFLNSLATMAAQLGAFLTLAGTGLSLIPGYQASAGAVAAGAGLLALAGVLRGLAALAGASKGGGTAFGAPGSATGGWAGVPTAEQRESGRTIVINIDSGLLLDDKESIARKVKEAVEYAEAMGY